MVLRSKKLTQNLKANRSNLAILGDRSLTDVHQLIFFYPSFQSKPKIETMFLRGVESIDFFGMAVLD